MRNSQLDISSRTERHPTIHTPAWPKFFCYGVISKGIWPPRSPESDAVWLFHTGISKRDSLPKQTTNHRRLESKHHRRNSGNGQRTYWQGRCKIWRAGFNPVWTEVVATSGACHDVVTFRKKRAKSASNFVAIFSLVVKLLKKCRVLVASGTPCINGGHDVAQLVETLRYKPEGHWFDSRCSYWHISLT